MGESIKSPRIGSSDVTLPGHFVRDLTAIGPDPRLGPRSGV